MPEYNMRKISLLVFTILIFLLSSNISFATSNVAVAESDSAVAKNVDYELPYPGLLPDSPIYFLKIIRDKMAGFLISDPLRKAEFNLLQADKRLNAGTYLFNSAGRNDSTEKKEKKINLAISTVSKAENYFGESIQKVKEARSEGMETRETISKLINSSSKHQEILRSLEEKSPQNFRAGFDFQLQRAVSFEKEVVSLTLK